MLKIMHAILLFIFTLFSVISFFGILFGANPYSSGASIRILFFMTLFFSLAGIFSMFHVLPSALWRKTVAFETAFRRGMLLSALGVGLAVFQTFSMLNIGNAFAAFLLVVSLEMLALYKK